MRAFGVAVLLFVGCVMIPASPVSIPHPSSSPPPSTFSITEYALDANGLWSDHEIPLSDASMEAIHQASPASDDDIRAWNAEAEPDMQIQVMDEEENDIQAENDNETENETETEAKAETDNENENDDDITRYDDLEITQGSHGRMVLIPRSPRIGMRHILRYLTHLISELKTHTPLSRLTLKLKVEPVTPTPPPPPSHRRIRHRRPSPQLGIRYRPRSVALRLVPSRQLLHTRRILARCQMLLRNALQRMRTMRQMMIRERMKRLRRARHFRFPHRGVILFRSNNITTHAPTYQHVTRNKFEIEGEKNSTITIIAPRVNATFAHSIIVINRGTLILMNRSPNNTLSTIPDQSHGGGRFWIPRPLRHIMNVAAVDNDDESDMNVVVTNDHHEPGVDVAPAAEHDIEPDPQYLN